jgi:hypothetical protein
MELCEHLKPVLELVLKKGNRIINKEINAWDKAVLSITLKKKLSFKVIFM